MRSRDFPLIRQRIGVPEREPGLCKYFIFTSLNKIFCNIKTFIFRVGDRPEKNIRNQNRYSQHKNPDRPKPSREEHIERSKRQKTESTPV